MIAPMKKVHLVFLAREQDANLRALRDFGMVHLETIRPETAGYAKAQAARNALLQAIAAVPPLKKGARPKPVAQSGGAAAATFANDAAMGHEDTVALAQRVLELEEHTKALRSEAAALSREIERVLPWGEFEPAALTALRAKGVDIALYECDLRNLAALPPEAEIVILTKNKKTVRFALVVRHAAQATALGQEYRPFAPPEDSVSILQEKRRQLERDIDASTAQIAQASAAIPSFKRAVGRLDQEIAMETASASLASEGPVAYIKGYVPAKEGAALQAFCRKKGWASALDEPSPEDAPPTKVENNAIVRMIQPVMDFLGIVPGYREYEISNWFLLYFTLFTAMIFGDGGYGLILLAIAGFMAMRDRRSKGSVSDFVRLCIVLATATCLWGMATATWFSISPDKLPLVLQRMSVWALSGLNPQASQNIQVLCFAIGLVHMTTAHIKNIIRDRGSLKFLAQVGSILMLVGMFFFVLTLVVSAARFPTPGFALWFVLGGFLLNFIFAAYDGNILKSALEGLKNVIPNFLGAVGVFADIVSYIRLWAVGLAGSSLAGIINSMGGAMMKGLVMLAAGAAIILAGHSLNLVLSVLSVIVHGVRLNVLEFSNHLGMEWSGTKYDPFRVTHRDEEK